MLGEDFKNLIKEDSVLMRQTDDIMFNRVDNEYVMLSLKKNEYYGLNKIGSRIWELLETPIVFKDLIKKLMTEYSIEEKECIEDTLSFLKNMIDKRLLKIS